MVFWPEQCSRPDGEPCDCCWSWGHFSLTTAPDEAVLQRRLSMCVMLAVRTIMSILRILYHQSGTSILGIVWDVVSGVSDFFLTAQMLSTIERTKGRRKVPYLGTYMNRAHFGVSLFVCAVYQAIFSTFFLTDGDLRFDSLGILLMIILQWIARQPREDPPVKV